MSTWRLLGTLTPPRSRERVSARSLGTWNPWEKPWIPSPDPAIVVLDRKNPARSRHVRLYSVESEEGILRFGADQAASGMWRFYVPASRGEPWAFDVVSAKYAGFWRRSPTDRNDLPWPEPDETWTGRVSFLGELAQVEARAERIPHRGLSLCRLCHCRNGSRSFRFGNWEWPEGFGHYIARHHVRPSPEFEAFIRNHAYALSGPDSA